MPKHGSVVIMPDMEEIRQEYIYGNYSSVSSMFRVKGLDPSFRKYTKGWRKDKEQVLQFSEKIRTIVNLQAKNKKRPDPTPGQIAVAGSKLMSWDGKHAIRNDEISISTYTEMLDDAGITYPLAFIKRPLLQMDWTMVCESKENGRMAEDNLREFWEPFLRDSLTCLDYGFSGANPRWRSDGSNWFYKSPVFLHPATCSIKITEDGSFNGFTQDVSEGLKEIPVHKSLLFNYDSRMGNLYGRSILRAAYRYWYVDKYLYEFQFKGYERRLPGSFKAFAPEGKTLVRVKPDGTPEYENNLDMMQEVAESVRSNAVFTLLWREGTPFDVIDFSPSMEGLDHILKSHDSLDNLKAKAILVPDRIAGTDVGGSYNMAEVQSWWFANVVSSIMTTDIAGPLNHYFLEPFRIHNFGENSPKITWKPLPLSREKVAYLKEIFVEVMRNPQFTLASVIDPREMAKTIGVPIPTEGVVPEGVDPTREVIEPSDSSVPEREDPTPPTPSPAYEANLFSTIAAEVEEGNKIMAPSPDVISKYPPLDINHFVSQVGKIMAKQETDYLTELGKIGSVNTNTPVPIPQSKRDAVVKLIGKFARALYAEKIGKPEAIANTHLLESSTRAWLNGHAALMADEFLKETYDLAWMAVLEGFRKKLSLEATSKLVKKAFNYAINTVLPDFASSLVRRVYSFTEAK